MDGVRIDHKEVRIILQTQAVENAPEDVLMENRAVHRADQVYEEAMLQAASAVHLETKKFDWIASALWWAGWRVPPGYFTDDEDDAFDFDEQAKLRRWVERELDAIGGRSYAAIRPLLAGEDEGGPQE